MAFTLAQRFVRLQSTYNSLADFLHDNQKPALRHSNGQDDITHRALLEFVANFELPVPNHGCLSKPIVAIILPNGPLLAATVLATSTWYAAAPINPSAGYEQVAADIKLAGASAIISCQSESERLDLKQTGLDLFHVVQTPDGRLGTTKVWPENRSAPKDKYRPRNPNHDQDIGIVLFTSGTSGKKKVVPMTTKSIVCGVGFVIESWALTEIDTCLNMMPLYHVGGLIRNVYAPIFANGSTICCPGFDGNLFWDIADSMRPTWYYASPSMHQVILNEAANRPQALAKCEIRLICNAAGGLLPALAAQLRDTFSCVVLPSYGMTECMPISTPPIDYKLDRPGTSGISVGPELTVLDGNERPSRIGSVGRVCVRGEPLFKGYLQADGTLDTSHLTRDGWFDTGDMGYMDKDGYLYITGRNKEVINRGGELISPFEIENAIVTAAEQPGSAIFGRVSQALAFSVRHDVLQEVVGIILVTPPGKRRVDIRLLNEALKTSLQQVKWPVVVVYMEDVPKKNNKVLRIRLAERLGLPCDTDSTVYGDRHWDATCPPVDTDLSVAISASVCVVDHIKVQQAVKAVMPEHVDVFVQTSPDSGTIEAVLGPNRRFGVGGAAHYDSLVDDALLSAAKTRLLDALDANLIPHKFTTIPEPLPLTAIGTVDSQLLNARLEAMREQENSTLSSSTSGRITRIFAQLLSLDAKEIATHKDFMELGGDSLRAGKLLSILRSEFKMHLPVDLIFNSGSVDLLSRYIEKRLAESGSTGDSIDEEAGRPLPGCEKTYSSTNPFLLFVQLIPMVFLYPITRGFQWTCFIFALSHSNYLSTSEYLVGRLINLIASVYLAKLVAKSILPVVGILLKWIIIGYHREGLFPMWGGYHTRWWLAQKVVQVCGKGIFRATPWLEQLYYRLLGARIGRNVTLKNVQLGEWDLLDIQDGATLDGCTIRPMAGERNTSMLLGRITIGRNASVGLSSVVAPGTTIPEGTCIGPNSSSWEMGDDADESNRDLSATRTPEGHWALRLFITAPLWIIARLLYLTPWVLGLLGLVYGKAPEPGSSIASTLDWFAGGQRIGYHYLARALRNFFGPFLIFGFVALVRKILDLVFGPLIPGPTQAHGQIAIWRMELMRTLMPVPQFHDFTELFGSHYEATSVAIRMMGGRAGKRIYWPGTGPTIGDYHLIDVGNDVVFGSRSHLVTSDGTGSEMIQVGDGAMIADRAVLLPGVTVQKGAVMGSGAMTRRGKTYDAGGTYVGSKGGDSICLSRGNPGAGVRRRRGLSNKRVEFEESSGSMASTSESESKTTPLSSNQSTITISCDTYDEKEQTAAQEPTLSPFGRAFYEGKASYYVLGQFAIFLYSSFIIVFVHLYWDAASVSAVQIANLMYQHIDKFAKNGEIWRTYREPFIIFGLFSSFICVLAASASLVALAVVIASKWILLGRRQPGNYDWDKSSYCQRWQMLLAIEKIRLRCFAGTGILGLLTGTAYCAWYFRALGAKIGKDCAFFVNGELSLVFTEPDLLTLGDRVVVDNASLVGHINSRGKFDLNRLSVGDRCVLRTNSRLLSGAHMGNDSCLLEHTLIMGGDVVEEGRTMQGWPAERFTSSRV
ncbi:uncharacterized protein B0I36DRAFT_293654 [Microdochium trichocladiopsis]|uniref:Carrier domain-containing protein n=1 Tax=Microdochium trichocladiopsis TaxID=1682393 RepID=A0A9P9BQJ6_9PEZI|nr:uncharacterized protein B0I36DRAFT_293654 [Microdochium trichocladiopsis]KAH7025947.1 hypothetical protein B0I36DRAFT_293654 [Microdochium trichocladiopsis]